jgi:hypothetical protein
MKKRLNKEKETGYQKNFLPLDPRIEHARKHTGVIFYGF